MDVTALTFYAIVCGVLRWAGPRLGQPVVRFGIGALVGIVAGVGMAIIAMIADRMTLAWSQKWQRQYGLVAS